MILVLTSTVMSCCFTVAANAQQSKEHQALYSKPSVVRICNGYTGVLEWRGKQEKISRISCGSGFFINPDGYIATNAHVTEYAYKYGSASESEIRKAAFLELMEAKAQEFGSTRSQFEEEAKLSNFRYVHDVILPVCGEPLPFVVKKFGKPNGEGEDAAIIKIGIDNAPAIQLADSELVKLQDPVTVVGYPGAADQIPNCKSLHEASFSGGIISAKKEDENGNDILQLDATASPGNSGGPVMNAQGEVIGLATSVGTINNSPIFGITFVVPANTLKEYIQDAGTINQEGNTNKLYREGLQLYQKSCYSSAIQKFEAVKQLFSYHSEVDKLIKDSRQAISEGKESQGLLCGFDSKSSFQFPSGMIIVVIPVATILGVLFFFIRGRGVDFL